MVNKVHLVGNLGKDVQLRDLPSGSQVAEFSLATNRKWKSKEGEAKEETQWHNIKVFGRQAEIAAQYLHKGKQIFLEGRINYRSWDDRETGEKKYMTEIICDNFQMLGKKGDSGGFDGGRSYDSQETSVKDAGDIPF